MVQPRPTITPSPVPVKEKASDCTTREEWVAWLVAKQNVVQPTIPPSLTDRGGNVKEKKLDATDCKTREEWVAWNVARNVPPKIPPPSRTDWGDNAARSQLSPKDPPSRPTDRGSDAVRKPPCSSTVALSSTPPNYSYNNKNQSQKQSPPWQVQNIGGSRSEWRGDRSRSRSRSYGPSRDRSSHTGTNYKESATNGR